MKLFYKEYLDAIVYLAIHHDIDGRGLKSLSERRKNTSLSTVLYGLIEGSDGDQDFNLDPRIPKLLDRRKQKKRNVSFLRREGLNFFVKEAVRQSLGPEWYSHYETLRHHEEELDELYWTGRSPIEVILQFPHKSGHIPFGDVEPAEYYRIKDRFFDRLSRHLRGEGVENDQLSEKYIAHTAFTGTKDELLDHSKKIFARLLKGEEVEKALGLLEEQISFVYFRPTDVEKRSDRLAIAPEHVPTINSTAIQQEVANVTEGNVLRQAFKYLYASRGDKDLQSEQLLFAFKMHSVILKSILLAKPKNKKGGWKQDLEDL